MWLILQPLHLRLYTSQAGISISPYRSPPVNVRRRVIGLAVNVRGIHSFPCSLQPPPLWLSETGARWTKLDLMESDLEDYQSDQEHMQTANSMSQTGNSHSHIGLFSRMNVERSIFYAHQNHHHFDCQLQEHGRRSLTFRDAHAREIISLLVIICKRQRSRTLVLLSRSSSHSAW